MVRLRLRGARRDSGAVAVLTVILMSGVFVGLCSLVVDLGLARDTRRQAQNAADASALAAGNVLWLTPPTADFGRAVFAAKSLAAKNYGVSPADWAGCTDSSALGYWLDTQCISFDSPIAPTRVRVLAPVRQVPTPFAGIWGINIVRVSAAAQISMTAAGRAQCGLCVVGSGPHELQNGSINVSGADVAFNGALSAGPLGTITDIGGNINLQGTRPNRGSYFPEPQINQPAIVDPLLNMAMPDYSALHPQTNSCTQGPGIYDSLAAGCILAPGLYVLTGTTSLAGNSSIVGKDVTLYFICGTPLLPRACNSGETGGQLTMTGNASLTVTAPTSGPTTGLSIVADRNNAGTFSFRGNGAQTSTGTIYAPSGTLNYRGNGGGLVMDSLIVVADVSFDGTPSAFRSTYTNQANVWVPPGDMHLSQ